MGVDVSSDDVTGTAERNSQGWERRRDCEARAHLHRTAHHTLSTSDGHSKPHAPGVRSMRRNRATVTAEAARPRRETNSAQAPRSKRSAWEVGRYKEASSRQPNGRWIWEVKVQFRCMTRDNFMICSMGPRLVAFFLIEETPRVCALTDETATAFLPCWPWSILPVSRPLSSDPFTRIWVMPGLPTKQMPSQTFASLLYNTNSQL